MHRPIFSIGKIVPAVLCLLFLLTVSAFAHEITQVKYVKTGIFSSVVTANSDGSVEWNDGSDGVTFTEPENFLQGNITPAQWQELISMLTNAGYTVKRPVEGVEPSQRLVFTFSDGTGFVNLGPTTMDDEAVAAFIPIEKFFNDVAVSLGAPDVYTFYKLN